MSLRVLLYSKVNPADRGGVQAVLNRVAAHLVDRGHTVAKVWGWPNPDRSAGDMTYALPIPETRWGVPTLRSALHVGRALFRLGRELSRYRPAVVNSHFVTSESLYFVLLKPIFRYRLVLSVHGSDVLRPKPWDAPRLSMILRRADAITAVSALTAACIKAIPGVDPARVQVIPNGVEYAFWSAGSPEPHLGRRPPTVLAVGRLHPIKGHDVLLHAFARVRERLPDARLVIVGDGGSRAALEGLAAVLKLGCHVTFTGELDAVGVRTWMGQSRCLALPSRSEGLPLTMLEAMAAGLPVVASAVGGVPEVLAPGTGVQVAPEDPAALADALSAVLLDAGLSANLSRRARERARQYSAIDADAAYEALLLQLDAP